MGPRLGSGSLARSGSPAVRVSAVALSAVFVCAMATACGGDDDAGVPASTTEFVMPTTTSTSGSEPGVEPDVESGLEGDEDVSDADFYAELGFTDEEISCLLASPIHADLISAPAISAPGDPTPSSVLLHYEGATSPVVISMSLTTSTAVEAQVLAQLAGDCASADQLNVLAAANGEALDAQVIDEILPQYLASRRLDGADDTELACLDTAFRSAPAFLGPVVDAPALIESACASAERRGAWRQSALRRGLSVTDATSAETDCLIATPDDLAALDSVLAAIEVEGGSNVELLDDASTTCVSARRLGVIGAQIAEQGGDFGVEQLS